MYEVDSLHVSRGDLGPCCCSLRASSLGGGGAIEGKMEKELPTMSQEFEYLHRKFQCKMLIGGDLIWE